MLRDHRREGGVDYMCFVTLGGCRHLQEIVPCIKGIGVEIAEKTRVDVPVFSSPDSMGVLRQLLGSRVQNSTAKLSPKG